MANAHSRVAGLFFLPAAIDSQCARRNVFHGTTSLSMVFIIQAGRLFYTGASTSARSSRLCQCMIVSGLTMLAVSFRTFRPSVLPSTEWVFQVVSCFF